MLRHCTKLRSLASSLPNRNLYPTVSSYRLLHFSSSGFTQTLNFPSSRYGYTSAATTGFPLTNGVSRLAASPTGCTSLPHHFIQLRTISSKEQKAKWKKKWRPRTPVTSKVKKTKMKFYSSYKDRFKTLNDGTIRRWKEGKRHNAHLKSKKSKRRLRQPALVPLAYAKVMKKLNFCN